MRSVCLLNLQKIHIKKYTDDELMMTNLTFISVICNVNEETNLKGNDKKQTLEIYLHHGHFCFDFFNFFVFSEHA